MHSVHSQVSINDGTFALGDDGITNMTSISSGFKSKHYHMAGAVLGTGVMTSIDTFSWTAGSFTGAGSLVLDGNSSVRCL